MEPDDVTQRPAARMPPPDCAEREEIHLRDITLRGFRRADGLFDLEGRLTDRKTEAFQVGCGPLVPPMALIHDIRVRLTIDLELRIHAAVAGSEVTPYSLCTSAGDSLHVLVGRQLARGWRKTVVDLVGGTQGCTHMREVLVALGSAAFQSLIPYKQGHLGPTDTTEPRPALLDTCVSFSSQSPIVAMRWPEHHRRSEGAA